MPIAKKLLVLALGCIPLAVPAQDKGGSSACRADAQKFCAQAMGGGAKVMDCLLDHQQEISDGCYDALKARLNQQRGAESRPAPAAGPVYRSRQADGRTVYSDAPQPNAAVQGEVPMDRVIFTPPPR